jgi:gamma-glutamyltranspeptidase/glutathione hydrolase
MEDLAQYQAKPRAVLRAKYTIDEHNWEVISSPPPSSGGVAIIEALNILKSVPLKGWDDIESVHMVGETMRRVFADRAASGRSDFAKVPVDGLISGCYGRDCSDD